jgi:hypothetical protein
VDILAMLVGPGASPIKPLQTYKVSLRTFWKFFSIDDKGKRPSSRK